jgi:hypothetical protein
MHFHSSAQVRRQGHYQDVRAAAGHILFDAGGRCVTDFLIRYESLQPDFDTVCDRLATSRVTLPRINVGDHLDYRTYFDDECRTLFEQRFAGDIAAFGYSY